MKRILTSLCITWILLTSLLLTAFGQSPDYQLNLRRNFGYNSGKQIKGNFTVSIVGATGNIKSVRYTLDGKLMSEVNQSPFSLTFETTNYAYGDHELGATIQLLDGNTLTATPKAVEFATPDQEAASVSGIILPIVGLLVLITGGGLAFQFLVLRNRPFKELAPGTQRNYGLTGGTVCPRCHRPFVFHWWSLKLVGYKYDRCEFCGKSGMMRMMSHSALRAAEQAELTSMNAAPAITQKTEEDKLKDMLDQSRYTDHS
jgi:hypothetical protein